MIYLHSQIHPLVQLQNHILPVTITDTSIIYDSTGLEPPIQDGFEGTYIQRWLWPECEFRRFHVDVKDYLIFTAICSHFNIQKEVKSAQCETCPYRPRNIKEIPIVLKLPIKPAPIKPVPIKRAIHYTKAVVEWVAKGLPERTQEEVESILSTYCKPCDWHDNGVCKGCGCNVNELRFAILNKIKMKTQHCPKGLW
jgi:hypothetical protein